MAQRANRTDYAGGENERQVIRNTIGDSDSKMSGDRIEKEIQRRVVPSQGGPDLLYGLTL
jgi:hypothetical protein